jgi:hypothetical protein
VADFTALQRYRPAMMAASLYRQDSDNPFCGSLAKSCIYV